MKDIERFLAVVEISLVKFSLKKSQKLQNSKIISAPTRYVLPTIRISYISHEPILVISARISLYLLYTSQNIKLILVYKESSIFIIFINSKTSIVGNSLSSSNSIVLHNAIRQLFYLQSFRIQTRRVQEISSFLSKIS